VRFISVFRICGYILSCKINNTKPRLKSLWVKQSVSEIFVQPMYYLSPYVMYD
jgi:hypothetical protein